MTVHKLPTLNGEPFLQVVCETCGCGMMTIWSRDKEIMAYCCNCAEGQILVDEEGEQGWVDFEPDF